MCKGVWVHIWKFRASPKNFAYGHASMLVRDKRGRKSYISWWPDTRSNTTTPYIFSKAYDAYPKAMRSYEQDKRNENGQDADHTIEITGLNEEKIIDHWENFSLQEDGKRLESGPLQRWSAVDLNCSTVVFDALAAGGASEYAMNYWFSRYWTPNRILEFSQNVKHQLSVGKQ